MYSAINYAISYIWSINNPISLVIVFMLGIFFGAFMYTKYKYYLNSNQIFFFTFVTSSVTTFITGVVRVLYGKDNSVILHFILWTPIWIALSLSTALTFDYLVKRFIRKFSKGFH